MMKYLMKDYEPQQVLKYFEDICSIPHGSKNEKALAEYILKLAKAKNLKSSIDEAGNIFVQKPGTCKNDKIFPLLFQGHMDMVCVKDEDCVLNMDTEPIKLLLENDILKAEKTSLGADNAVGLCNMLAIMESEDLIHPPLEFLFTVEEEIGLQGIQKFNMDQIKAKRMLTMDCGEPNIMIIGSAGTLKTEISKKCNMEKLSGNIYKITVKGLLGGHSGIDVGKNRGSATRIMAQILDCLIETVQINLISFYIKGNGNSIPNEGEALIAIKKEYIVEAENALSILYSNIYKEYRYLEKGLNLNFESFSSKEDMMISKADTEAIKDLMILLPSDVQKCDEDNPAWKICSAFLLNAYCNKGIFTGSFVIRANINELKYSVLRQAQRICTLCFTELEIKDDTPAWSRKTNSKLQNICKNTYKELFGNELEVAPVHGGVEASIVAFAIPEMDIIGMAPCSRGAHTTKEHLYVNSMKPFWDYLVRLLENMCICN